MNASVRLWGTWILSILFVVWIVVAWAASGMLVLIAGLSFAVTPYPIWWSVAGSAVISILPVCVAAAGLCLWATRFPWLAIVPALIAVTGISVVGWHAFGR